MCGIWSRVRFDKKIEENELLFPVAALSHRGPDGYGWWSDSEVALVHTRLSIIDLGGGAQPLCSHDGKWVGIVNGELYDYESVRDELINRGIKFRTKSDSEVLLNLYAVDGVKGLGQISGEFAFIFYNRETRQMHFGRDPFGVKPLFFENRADSLTLASETKALQDEAPDFSPEYLRAFIARTIVPPQTCLKNVEHVWPSRVYKFDLKTRKMSWDSYQKLPLGEKRTLSGESSLEKLEFELKAAVKRRLRADVEIGCYLSGGIDSALISALAADQGTRLKAFTVGFVDRDFDETQQAADIASDLGHTHSVVKLTSKNFMDSLSQSIVAFENPITNPHGAAKNLLAAHAGAQVKVVLTGEGADEWMGGYAYLRIKKIQNFAARHPRLGMNALSLFLDREMGMSQNHLDGSSREFEELARSYFGNHSPALLGRLAKKRYFHFVADRELPAEVKGFCQNLKNRLDEEHANLNEWDLNTWMALRTDLLHYILANVGDRQEMSHSLEGRTPFLDPKVVKIAGQMRESFLIRGLTEKYPLRKIAQKYLKPADSERGKRPFFAPMKYMYLRENRPMVEEMLIKAKAETPWLNWKNIDMFFGNKKRSIRSPLENNVASLRLTLFSIGVLAQSLRARPVHQPRGYALPIKVSDIMPFERKF